MGSWVPPLHNKLKYNTDAASLGNHQWGLGVVYRDSVGKVLKAATKGVVAEDSPAVAECFVARWALELSLNWGF